LPEIFVILRRTDPDVIINVHMSCRILMKLEFSRQIFEKYSNINFHEDTSSGSRFVSRGRTDMEKLIVAFHNFANVKWNTIPPVFVTETTHKNCNPNTNIPLHKVQNLNTKVSMKFPEYLIVIIIEDWYQNHVGDIWCNGGTVQVSAYGNAKTANRKRLLIPYRISAPIMLNSFGGSGSNSVQRY
jgi:hypothetical protein